LLQSFELPEDLIKLVFVFVKLAVEGAVLSFGYMQLFIKRVDLLE
jgi:hypothetical protein